MKMVFRAARDREKTILEVFVWMQQVEVSFPGLLPVCEFLLTENYPLEHLSKYRNEGFGLEN